MIFSHKRTILFITKDKIQWMAGRVPDGKLLGEVQSLPWSEENLHAALDIIADKFPKKLRIVIGEEFSYVTHFIKNNKKTTIVSEAQAFIPEELRDGWDSREEKTGEVQVMAVQQELFSMLKKALSERSLRVEAIEAESVSIARMVQKHECKAAIFARSEGKTILGVVQCVEILATKVFSKFPAKEQIKKFIDLAVIPKDAVTKVYIQDESGKLAEIFKELGVEAQVLDLDPMLGVCHKKDLTGRDKDVLNIFLDQGGAQLNKSENSHNHLSLREKILLGIFLAAIIGSAVTVYFVQKNRQKAVKMMPTTQGVISDQSGLKWTK